MTSIEIITVNFRTEDLLIRLYKSIRELLGDIPFRVIDGSGDNKYVALFKSMVVSDTNTSIEKFPFNIHHGRGMNYAMATTKYDYILFIDSDGWVKDSGLVEYMAKSLKPDSYGSGLVVTVNKGGDNVAANGIRYLHPSCALVKKSEYVKYPRYIHHGAPCIKTMHYLHLLSLSHKLIHLDNIDRYFTEDKRGTVNRTGYQTGAPDEPMINILIRTSGRPNYFKKCYESIARQSYSNYRIIVSCDDDESEEYVSKYNVDCVVRVERVDSATIKPCRYPEHAALTSAAPYNGYFKEMYKYVAEGWVVHLDDDDAFNTPFALKVMGEQMKATDTMLFWRCQFTKDMVIPDDVNFRKPPAYCKISGITYAFHTMYCKYADWGLHKVGDFRVADKLYKIIKQKAYINKVLTMIQRERPGGLGRRDDLILK